MSAETARPGADAALTHRPFSIRAWITFKAVALAILLGLIGEPAGAESFPTGDVFRPLVADSAEPRFFISVLSVDRSNDKLTVGSIGGPAPFGQYFRHNVSYYGAGVQFDL